MEMDCIDVISADCIEAGDVIEVDGLTYEVLTIEDEGDMLIVSVNALDEANDKDEIPLDPFQEVRLMGYVYDEVDA